MKKARGDRNSMIEATSANLRNAEIDSLHFANVLYWREGSEHTREAAVEYQRRKDRLRELTSTRLTELGL